MLNRFSYALVLVVLLASSCSNKMVLTKNNTMKSATIYLPKKLTVLYRTDSGVVRLRGTAYSYTFPVLMMKKKSDTLSLDVTHIELLRNTSPLLPVNYLGMLVTVNAAVGLSLSAVHQPSFLTGAIGFLGCGFIIFKATHTKRDLKREWSFKDNRE